ncbi:hypothetical protein LTR10_006562 [Elasticomyces elasticus]|nr:hypothetical protein LTR10_006562 [Elasticomyces elasticus]KAK4973036.1 hypothetical protein LTR42_006330 [Elasticomyces elasticus]
MLGARRDGGTVEVSVYLTTPTTNRKVNNLDQSSDKEGYHADCSLQDPEPEEQVEALLFHTTLVELSDNMKAFIRRPANMPDN